MTTKKSLKLHDRKAFIAGTIIGGPLAASVYFYDNFKNQGNRRAAKLSLLLGPVLLVGITLLAIAFETLPRAVFAFIPVGVVIGLYMQFQDKKVEQHVKAGGTLHRPRTVSIALISMVVTVLLFLGYLKAVIAVTDTDITIWEAIGLSAEYDRGTYQKKMAEFTKNDEYGVKVLTSPAGTPPEEIIAGLDESLALYQKNQVILNEIAAIDGLPAALEKDNRRLKKYLELRIEMYELIKKSVVEDTTAYDAEIEALVTQLKPYLETE